MMNPDYISRNKLKKDYPKCFENFLKFNGDSYYNFNTAIDSFLYSFGIGIITPFITDKTGERILGYQSILKYYPDNKCGFTPGEHYYIEDYKKFKTAFKAMKATIIHSLDILEEVFSFRRVQK